MFDFSYLTGGYELDFIFSALFYWLIAVVLVKSVRYSRKNKGTPRGGKKFSFKFWINDNFSGIIAHFCLAVLTLRFPQQLVEYFNLHYKFDADPMWIYVFLGLAGQTIIDLIQKTKRENQI